MIGYIYIIHNKLSPKVYIGQTTRSIEQRFNEHIRRDQKQKTKLGQAIKKYGQENFYVELLETINGDKETLSKAEQKWIKYYDSFNKGYNMTKGGETFYINSDKMRQVEQRDKVTGIILNTFNSISEASRAVVGNESGRANIVKCCNKNILSAYGYKWTFKGDNIILSRKKGDMKKIPVIMCDKITHKPLKEFLSAKDAADFLCKTNGSNITACCKGKARSAYGYFWKYKEIKNA